MSAISNATSSRASIASGRSSDGCHSLQDGERPAVCRTPVHDIELDCASKASLFNSRACSSCGQEKRPDTTTSVSSPPSRPRLWMPASRRGAAVRGSDGSPPPLLLPSLLHQTQMISALIGSGKHGHALHSSSISMPKPLECPQLWRASVCGRTQQQRHAPWRLEAETQPRSCTPEQGQQHVRPRPSSRLELWYRSTSKQQRATHPAASSRCRLRLSRTKNTAARTLSATAHGRHRRSGHPNGTPRRYLVRNESPSESQADIDAKAHLEP